MQGEVIARGIASRDEAVGLFDITGSQITIIALRHQREDDFLY